ncbi:MAG: guanylate kinase [bacterium]
MIKKEHLLHGKIFVLSAPSGAGKTSLLNNLKNKFPYLVESVSCTTRKPRVNEKEGVDYYFLSVDEFMKKKKEGVFVETAEVHGNFYGTPLSFIESRVVDKINVICDIDYQGAINIKKAFPKESVLIFILPPSMNELEKRLRGRATDDERVVKQRLENAKNEITFYPFYNHIVINDDFERASSQLEHIIMANTESSILYNFETIRKLIE